MTGFEFRYTSSRPTERAGIFSPQSYYTSAAIALKRSWASRLPEDGRINAVVKEKTLSPQSQ